MTTLVDNKLNWAFVEAFRWPGDLPEPAPANWKPVAEWMALLDAAKRDEVVPVQALIQQWDDTLSVLGGEPSKKSWADFRPLRLSREEDWSNWLAHLLSSSGTGWFAAALLKISVEDKSGEHAALARPAVLREKTIVENKRRADLVVNWQGGRHTHVEVKVWDLHLDKTLETAQGLQRQIGADTGLWSDYILIPEESVGEWEACIDLWPEAEQATIRVITWTDVAVALRTALANKGEDLPWQVWAATFLGNVEEKILGIQAATEQELLGLDWPVIRRKFHVLQRGLNHV